MALQLKKDEKKEAAVPAVPPPPAAVPKPASAAVPKPVQTTAVVSKPAPVKASPGFRAQASASRGGGLGSFCMVLAALALLGTLGIQFFAMKAMFAF